MGKQPIVRNIIYLLLCLLWVSCSKMDASYKEYVIPNGINYIGKADSVKILSGRQRVEITWLRGTDPKTKRAIIYWDNMADSLEIPITAVNPMDTVRVFIDSLPENSYNFDIFTLDNDGHSSVGVNALGTSYGSIYESSLLIRPVNTVRDSDNNAIIDWFPSDTTSFASEILYRDAAGTDIRAYAPGDSAITVLKNYLPGTSFIYRSLYRPEASCLDTFYTAYDTVMVFGPPIPISKAGWTATASSEDSKSGRVAAQAIDNDISTMWFSGVAAGRTYPHTLTVDMGQPLASIFGFSFVQRSGLAIKDVELTVSMDGQTWKSLGRFTLSSSVDEQYIDFANTETFRYFKVVCLDGWKDDPNASIMEVGLYKR